MLLSAGDDVGASPVTSALFHDEPTRLLLEVGGMRVGVIGATLRTLPTLVSSDASAGPKVGDEVEAIDRASAALTQDGVRSPSLLALAARRDTRMSR